MIVILFSKANSSLLLILPTLNKPSTNLGKLSSSLNNFCQKSNLTIWRATMISVPISQIPGLISKISFTNSKLEPPSTIFSSSSNPLKISTSSNTETSPAVIPIYFSHPNLHKDKKLPKDLALKIFNSKSKKGHLPKSPLLNL